MRGSFVPRLSLSRAVPFLLQRILPSPLHDKESSLSPGHGSPFVGIAKEQRFARLGAAIVSQRIRSEHGKKKRKKKEGAKNSPEQHTIYGRKSQTARIERSSGHRGMGQSARGFGLSPGQHRKTRQIAGFRVKTQKLALATCKHFLVGKAPGKSGKEKPLSGPRNRHSPSHRLGSLRNNNLYKLETLEAQERTNLLAIPTALLLCELVCAREKGQCGATQGHTRVGLVRQCGGAAWVRGEVCVCGGGRGERELVGMQE